MGSYAGGQQVLGQAGQGQGPCWVLSLACGASEQIQPSATRRPPRISTNTNLYKNKPNWIDFNAGVIAEGEPMEQVAKRFAEFVIAVANGTKTNNEKNGYHEIAIFKNGVTL